MRKHVAVAVALKNPMEFAKKNAESDRNRITKGEKGVDKDLSSGSPHTLFHVEQEGFSQRANKFDQRRTHESFVFGGLLKLHSRRVTCIGPCISSNTATFLSSPARAVDDPLWH